MRKLLSRFGIRRSLSSVLSSFENTVTELHDVAKAHESARSKKLNRVNQLQAQSASHAATASRARNVAAKIEDLVS